MLNPFPDLLIYSTLGPLVLRVLVGIIFIDLGYLKFKSERKTWETAFNTFGIRPADFFLPIYALIQIVGGAMLFIGAWTQIAALILAIFTGIELFIEWKEGNILRRDLVFYILVFSICLSLLLTGAGAFAFDIPL